MALGGILTFPFSHSLGYERLTSGGRFGLYGSVPFWIPEIPSLQSLHLDPVASSVQPRVKSGPILGNCLQILDQGGFWVEIETIQCTDM